MGCPAAGRMPAGVAGTLTLSSSCPSMLPDSVEGRQRQPRRSTQARSSVVRSPAEASLSGCELSRVAGRTTAKVALASRGSMMLLRDAQTRSRQTRGQGRPASVSHRADDGRGAPVCVECQAKRTHSGRPSSSMWFKTLMAKAISVPRLRSVRERSPSPITRLNLLISASTSARQ